MSQIRLIDYQDANVGAVGDVIWSILNVGDVIWSILNVGDVIWSILVLERNNWASLSYYYLIKGFEVQISENTYRGCCQKHHYQGRTGIFQAETQILVFFPGVEGGGLASFRAWNRPWKYRFECPAGKGIHAPLIPFINYRVYLEIVKNVFIHLLSC